MARKIVIPIVEMRDAEATGIALVERGANKMPFKIIKDDAAPGARQKRGSTMDWKQVFSGKAKAKAKAKSEDAAQGVLAVVASPDADPKAIEKMIKRAGLKVVEKITKTKDGRTIFRTVKGAELEGDNIGVVQLSEAHAIVCGFNPSMSSTSFDENLDQHGFIPGFDVATSVLRDTVFNALFNAKDKGDAAELIAKAVEDYGTHVTDLARSLPMDAFKLDLFFADHEPTKAAKADEGEESEDGDGEDATGVAADFEDMADQVVEGVTAALEKTATKLTEKMDELGEKVDKVEEKADNAAKLARGARKAARGRLSLVADDDPPTGRRQRDEEDDEREIELAEDTGLARVRFGRASRRGARR